jgi:hypothetical protein
MTRILLGLLVAAGVGLILAPRHVEAGDIYAQRRAAESSWHGPYYHTDWGMPLALVMPPTVRMQTSWSWGVAQTERYPIWHQFKRPAVNPGASGSYGMLPTPLWPSHTDQFGVYYVRAPWGQRR